ncbi:acyl-CoA thioesterase [Bacillus sp. 2205SS5-2]|uniref:acyl-CoA thioesterase n=1 Tax=Bacillus sp. 2205SS5-2 TaxID=3109031 RepID=UPI00300597BE
MSFTSYQTVRFHETDALGHINNACYFNYFEEARIQLFKELGAEVSTEAWNFILASTKCDFLNQGYFNQTLRIETTISQIGNKSFTMTHDIYDSETNVSIAHGAGVIVYFDFKQQQSVPIPDDFREKLREYMKK